MYSHLPLVVEADLQLLSAKNPTQLRVTDGVMDMIVNALRIENADLTKVYSGRKTICYRATMEQHLPPRPDGTVVQ
jgi:hypothetical protein